MVDLVEDKVVVPSVVGFVVDIVVVPSVVGPLEVDLEVVP